MFFFIFMKLNLVKKSLKIFENVFLLEKIYKKKRSKNSQFDSFFFLEKHGKASKIITNILK